jgi:hypothetical protein
LIGLRTKEALVPDLYTHINMDIDSMSSCWAVRKFVPGMSNAHIIRVGADWDGKDMKPGDMAVDIFAGGLGIKGIQDPDGTVHSSFAYIVSKYVKPEDAEAIRDLVRFIDIQDAHGSVVNYMTKNSMIYNSDHETRRLISLTSVGAIFRAIEARFPNDPDTVFNRMCEIFDGYLEMGGAAERRARSEAERAELFANGRVALVKDKKEKRTDHILWERHVQVIVYVDGDNLGVLRRGEGFPLRDGSRFRAGHPEVKKLVRQAGELPLWFEHSKGFLFCKGSRKAPSSSRSNVNPYELVRVIENVLERESAR